MYLLFFYFGVLLAVVIPFLVMLWIENKFLRQTSSGGDVESQQSSAANVQAVDTTSHCPPSPSPSYTKFAPPSYSEAIAQNNNSKVTVYCVSKHYEKVIQVSVAAAANK